jgi:diacylglycerol kinase (ATP)
MRARLIVNPSSGTDLAPQLLPLVNERLRTIVTDLDITMTTGVADVERAAARALEEKCDALYVAGGDGTVNAALRRIALDEAPPMAIGVIPFGTGNDFSKALGLGEDPEAAVEMLLDRRVVAVDIGMLNDRLFVNTSAGGFIADVSAELTEGLKDAAGKLAFVIGSARALFGTDPFSAQLSAGPGSSGDPVPVTALDIQMFAVCNSRFIGGGYVLAPDAVIDDGLVDVLVVPRMPMLEFIVVLQRLASGSDPGHPGVVRFRSSSFDFEFSRRTRVNIDGELLETDSCRYRVRHAAATFFCGPEPLTVAKPRTLS